MGRLSGQMLESARAGDWDGLVALEQARSVLETEVRQYDKLAWDGQAAADKAQLLRQILTGSGEIAALAAARMKELRAPMSQVSMAIKINQAYKT